jgi:hypothetical protein
MFAEDDIFQRGFLYHPDLSVSFKIVNSIKFIKNSMVEEKRQSEKQYVSGCRKQ